MSAIDQKKDIATLADEAREERVARMKFFNDMIIGEIRYVSYYGDLLAFVRCEVVPYDGAGGYAECGIYKALKPLGLVGKFDKNDLDRRDCYGEPMTGAAANLVREGKPFLPYVNHVFTEKNVPGNIKICADHQLIIPPMTEKEKESADLWCRIKRAENTAKYAMSSDDPKAVIKKIVLDLLG